MNAISRTPFAGFGGWRSAPDVRLERPARVTVQITEHAGLGHRGPVTHFDPPCARRLLRLLIRDLRRAAIDLCLSREPDGRLALRAGAAEAHAPLAYIEGLSTADAILSLAELAQGAGA
jgi:hypothetical protein